MFVTNNKHNKEADEYVKKFNTEHPKYIAQIFYLDDIKEKYYGEAQQNKTNFSVKIESVNTGTILNIRTKEYKLENVIDAKYVLTPVVNVYRIYRESKEKGYPIFDKNIREYLGNKGINKSIYQTLLNEDDRKNFFYYNNGITVICDKMSTIETQALGNNRNAAFSIKNPQIVNGCQTVNSIYEALRNINPDNLEEEFKDTFVMLKILEIDKSNNEDNKLYQDIVKFTNSQNAIKEETFVANTEIFNRLQKEFEAKGFLLLVKQSDKNKFAEQYKTFTKFKELSSERLKQFGIKEATKASDVHIPLEKFLQVVNAFVAGGHVAYMKKKNMLKFDTEQYKAAIDFIKDENVTNNIMLDLYMLYKRAEQAKKEKNDNRSPIPYYLIDGFAKYECENRNVAKIAEQLDDSEKINKIIKLYSAVSKAYTKEYHKKNGVDYNKMIKQNVDYDIFDSQRDTLIDAL